MQIQAEIISLVQFEDLFKSQYSNLCAIANSFLKDLDASEEVVQAVFVKFWENRNSVEIKQSFNGYLATAVKNNCLNQLKHLKVTEAYKEHNKREIEYEESRERHENDGNELSDKIKLSIDQLPEGRKKIFILSRYEGLKYREIADKLGISIKTVENQMGSALKFLKNELSEYIVSLLLLLFFVIH